MFIESLLDSATRPPRRWTTLLSFALQTLAVAALVLLPLFYTQALPGIATLAPLIGPPPAPAPRTAAAAPRASQRSDSELVDRTVRVPVHLPQRAAIIHDTAAPEPSTGAAPWGVPGSTGAPASGSHFISLLGPPPVPHLTPPPTPPCPVISSGVSPGLLVRQVKPVYPPLAIAARVQGSVVLNAVISRSGVIDNLRVVSGHPMLVPAALEAVKLWRYRPYRLNDQPTEVETQIIVNFSLGQ